jgi:hypothetical protein
MPVTEDACTVPMAYYVKITVPHLVLLNDRNLSIYSEISIYRSQIYHFPASIIQFLWSLNKLISFINFT